ncbi:MAG: ADP-ribosylglycohydrolase family protein [Candidatus Bathyarchaeia archaeon]
MRVAPIGLLYYDEPDRLRVVAYAQSRITHAHPLGVEGAALQAYAVALAVMENPRRGLDTKDFLAKLLNFTSNEVYRRKLRLAGELLAGNVDPRGVIKVLGNGVEAFNSVPTAIYCFLKNHKSFRETVIYTVSLGGDTDTIAAMAGAISGAYHGLETIPAEWLERLERRSYIEGLAEQLWRLKELGLGNKN